MPIRGMCCRCGRYSVCMTTRLATMGGSRACACRLCLWCLSVSMFGRADTLAHGTGVNTEADFVECLAAQVGNGGENSGFSKCPYRRVGAAAGAGRLATLTCRSVPFRRLALREETCFVEHVELTLTRRCAAHRAGIGLQVQADSCVRHGRHHGAVAGRRATVRVPHVLTLFAGGKGGGEAAPATSTCV